MNNYRELETEPVGRLINKYAFSTITAVLITQIYNAVDNYFIGKINTQASAAIGIAMSAMAIIQAIGFLFGQGSGNAISLYLGHKDLKKASEVASIGFFGAMFFGLIITILGVSFVDKLAVILGSTETVLPYSIDYLSIIFWGAFYHCATLVMNVQLRCQGKAFYSMIGLMIGAVLNMVLDPILIFGLGLGIKGAALATIISQFVSFTILLHNHMKFDVKLSIKNIQIKKEYIMDIFKGGTPSLARQGINSVGVIALNHAAAFYGDAAIAAMGIVTRIGLLSNSVIIGYGHAFQPVCGYNYSAKRFDRVWDGFWYCVKRSTIILICLSALLWIFSDNVIDIFINDSEVVRIGSTTLKFHTFFMFLNGFMILATLMMQTIQMATQASILSMLRMGLILIPVVSILPKFIGLTGVQLAQPIADIISVICTAIVAKPLLIKLKKKRSIKSLQV